MGFAFLNPRLFIFDPFGIMVTHVVVERLERIPDGTSTGVEAVKVHRRPTTGCRGFCPGILQIVPDLVAGSRNFTGRMPEPHPKFTGRMPVPLSNSTRQNAGATLGAPVPYFMLLS